MEQQAIERGHKESPLTVLVFGNSASIQFRRDNFLLGEEQSRFSSTGTSRIIPLQREIADRYISVINMTGLHETELNLDCVDHLIELLNENEIHAFIFVVRQGQLTNDDKMGLDQLQRVFGDKVLQFVIFLFTYEREEEHTTIEDDLKKNPALVQLLENCGGRYQTCNKMMNNQSEMRDLMKKIEHLFNENQQQGYTGEMFNTERKNYFQKSKNESDESKFKKDSMEHTTMTGTKETHKVCNG
ncbi:hypothetical protein ABG768_020582 [Culter alburnus]|uniref:AIG1-type G domain-containing protein n=1 Tax=Culter alburnus TaxID=194366 RepID=A0AAW2B1Z8_CULAL